MKPTVFIHTNAQQLTGALVAEYSLKASSSHSHEFDVKVINVEDYPHLTEHEGDPYRRKGQKVVWHNRDLQSFTPLRFRVPQEMGYQGRALVIDPDIFAKGDVAELLSMEMDDHAIRCRYIERESGPPFYASSVLLLDCAKLTHWRWEEQIDAMFAQKFDYGDWVSLRLEPPETIGDLPEEWNHFDTLDERTKLLHNTERLTQPWKTGLPIDFNLNYDVAPSPVRKLINAVTGRKPQAPQLATGPGGEQHYQPHPEPEQERFFFSLLQGAIDAGVIDEAFLREEIEHKHVRPDVFEILSSFQRA